MKRLVYLVCVLMGTVSAIAQQTIGAIHGSVLDATNAAIPGATITATGPDNWTRTAVSDGDGRYSLHGLPSGAYSVRAAATGFMQPHVAHVHVQNDSIALNITLQVEGHEETVTVEGNSERITIGTDSAQNASATHVTAKGLDSLSNDPDDFVTDIQTLAGPSAGLEGAQVYIDGLTAGDAVLPDKAAIQEIRINQNPFAPEFDSMGLGRVELLTKAGADAYHATAFFSYGDALFNSRNPYAPEKPPFTLKQYGGSVSGPISKKLSFFFDLNKRDIGNGAVINA